MSLEIANKWFETRKIDADITLLWEPHVVALYRCNIWHIRGTKQDLLVDSGLGVIGLRNAAKNLFEHTTIALATHSHVDHTGCFHEFDVRAAHPAEADRFILDAASSLRVDQMPDKFLNYLESVGYGITSEYLITALPDKNFDIEGWRQTGANPTWLVNE
ncbi:MAG: glyoxylase-like metal-dependent hydrolase (beta-lactamase superfamily II), partial [Gammaproteobacteria bacterium]